MSTTPSHTPNNKKSNKRLPMIVDIAIDDSGKQLYQVHESSRYVRKEMPKSTNFNSAGLINDYEEEKTPIRKILGTISPSTLNQKKASDDDNSEDSHITDMDVSSKPYSVGNLFNDDLGLDSSHYLLQHSIGFDHETGSSSDAQRDYSSTMNSNASSTDIWSADVEEAFEEVLSIIPKNGLSKIKISGRSCGRNELISDYILTKTGKYRTRKQVSSHIQVIKNLGQKHHIIKLINEGPGFKTKQEQEENNRRFEEIFSKINLDKSLGFRKTPKRSFMDASMDTAGMGPKPKRRPAANSSIPENKSHFLVNNFFMSIYDNSYANPIFLTVQKNDDNIKNLQLKRDANIANRFPSLNDFKSMDTPIFHNFVKLNYPDKLPYDYSLQTGLKTNWILKDTGNPSANLSIFTVVYSYGREVFKVNDTNIKSNENIPFLLKFWEYLLSHEMQTQVKQEEGLKLEGLNLKGLTIKQVVYDCSSIKVHNSFKVPKATIRQIILWEFAKVDDPKDAITTTTKLLLLDDASPLSGMSTAVPQVVNYSQSQYYPQSVSAALPTTSNTFVSNPTMVSSATSIDQTYMRAIDQSPIHKRFPSLDQASDPNHLSYATAQGQQGPKPQAVISSNAEQASLARLGSHHAGGYDIQVPTVLQPQQSHFVTMAPAVTQQYHQHSQQHINQNNIAGPAVPAGTTQFSQFDYMNPEYQVQGFLYNENNYNSGSNTNNTEY